MVNYDSYLVSAYTVYWYSRYCSIYRVKLMNILKRSMNVYLETRLLTPLNHFPLQRSDGPYLIWTGSPSQMGISKYLSASHRHEWNAMQIMPEASDITQMNIWHDKKTDAYTQHYFQSFFKLIFLSVSFFMTFVTAISKSS